eukprot:2509696-Pyramimonas_sp.AAC.1
MEGLTSLLSAFRRTTPRIWDYPSSIPWIMTSRMFHALPLSGRPGSPCGFFWQSCSWWCPVQ